MLILLPELFALSLKVWSKTVMVQSNGLVAVLQNNLKRWFCI